MNKPKHSWSWIGILASLVLLCFVAACGGRDRQRQVKNDGSTSFSQNSIGRTARGGAKLQLQEVRLMRESQEIQLPDSIDRECTSNEWEGDDSLKLQAINPEVSIYFNQFTQISEDEIELRVKGYSLREGMIDTIAVYR